MSVSRVKGPKGSCDTLFSQIVRSVRECARCGMRGEPRDFQCAHIRSRRYSVTRCMTDPQNAWCLCPKCHWETTEDGVEFHELVKKTCGLITYARLKRLSLNPRGVKVDWSEERKRLRRVLNEVT